MRALRHVLIDHLLAVGVEIAGGAIVGGGGKHVVRAEETYLLPVAAPTDDAVLVEVDGLRLHREQQGEDHRRRSRIRLCRVPILPGSGT
jgi:hypothetical protein